jgi:hypothetical protein
MDNEYIKNSHASALKNNKEKYLHKKLVYIKDPLSNDVDLDYVLEYVQKRIPEHLMHAVDAIYVGDFSFLNEKDVNATYLDGAMYISNKQSSEDDMIDDFVHEIAHAAEEILGEEIYFDNELESEFLGKRERLCFLLGSEGYKIPLEVCANAEYDEKFDKYLYQNVGYEKLTNITMGLFYSPYAATSLREYFANGFEHYFLGDREYLKNLSPNLYNKIVSIATY